MKEVTAKYHILQFIPGSSSASGTTLRSTPSHWTEEEKFTWEWFTGLPEEDKKYVADFCPANPTSKALLPHAKVSAGEPPERALYCQPWLSAKAKI